MARKPAGVLAILAIALIGLGLIVSNIFAQDQTANNTVELDGNIANDTTPGTDWGPAGALAGICQATGVLDGGNAYIGQAPLPAGILTSICKGDSYLTTLTQATILSGKAYGPDSTYFSSNKDIQDIQVPIPGVSGIWGCTQVNNPTPKDEILNVYAALGIIANGPNSGDTSLYVGFERGRNTGSSFQGVWFLQNPVSCTAPATGSANFSCSGSLGCHTAWTFDTTTSPWTVKTTGDILLLINFTGGGKTTTVQMYAWAPSVATRAQDAFPLLLLDGLNNVPFNAIGSDCQDSLTVGTGTNICATTNNPAWNPTTPTDACIVTAWPPANQSACVTGATGQTTDTGGSPILDKLQFYEGMVNLNSIFGTVPCFSQALFEARTSASPTATLKDYALGDFNTCGKIIVHKETDPDDASRSFSYSTTGGLLPAPGTFTLTDDGNNFNGCDYSGATPATTDDCGATGTRVFGKVAPGSYSVTEADPTTGTPVFDFESLTCQVNSGTATVNPNGTSTSSMTASIDIGVLGIVECQYNNRQRGTLEILKQDEGGADLAGSCFTITPDAAGGTPEFVVCDRTTTSDQTGNFANDGNTSPGVMCVSNMIWGDYTVSETTVPPGYFGAADQTATIDSTAACGSGETLTFVNKLGSIIVEKLDGNGDLLPGAGFTFTPDPFTGGAAGVEVKDGDTADHADGNDGRVCIDGVLKGTYSITESTVPAGYFGDSGTESVTVSSASTCADRLAATTITPDATFTNLLGSILVKKLDGHGNLLPGAGFTFTPNPFTGGATGVEVKDGDTADHADANNGLVCIDDVRKGTYSITETTVPAGYFGDSSTKSVTVSSPSNCADRLAAAVVTPDAIFTNLLGSILVKKLDGHGNLLPGAGFTFDPNPFTGGAAIEVKDGDTADHADANDGYVCIDDVRKGTYSITETTVPAGYSGDISAPSVTVSSPSTCAARLALTPITPDATFVNKLGSILVKKFDGHGNLLPGAGFTFDPSPFTAGGAAVEVKDGGALDHADSNDGIVCIDEVRMGTYDITETTVPPGFFGDSSKATVTVDAASTCADRLATVLQTADASFTNEKGSLSIIKLAKNKNVEGGIALLAGATFTITPNPLTGTGSLDILDGAVAPPVTDQYAAGGLLCIDDVWNLGTGNDYQVVEKSAPANYAKDTGTEIVGVHSPSTCAEQAAGHTADITFPADASFTNIPLSSIGVTFSSDAGAGVTVASIVCAEGLTTLNASSENGAPDPALDDSDEQFNSLKPGTYTCTIVIDP